MTNSAEAIERNSSSRSTGDLKRRRIKLVVMAAGFVCVGSAVVSDWHLSAASAKPYSQFSIATFVPSAPEQGNQEFSTFSHNSRSHERLPCLLCHRREGSATRPARSSQHAPCSGCHKEQFAASRGRRCAIR